LVIGDARKLLALRIAIRTVAISAAIGFLLITTALAPAATSDKAPSAPKATIPHQAAISLLATNSEAQCLEVLRSTASLMEKDAACARLKIVGTERCVPALAALLADEQLSHSAREVLEPMTSPAAWRALIVALDHTTGLIKAGIVASLGLRRERSAMTVLGKTLADPDFTVACAAATALGDIGGSDSLDVLRPAFGTSAEPLHRAVTDAILRCGQGFLAAGQTAQARAVFQELYAGRQPEAVQVAAFRGLLLSSGKLALNLMAGAITGKAGPAQTAALQVVHELDVPGATAVLAGLLPQLGPSLQAALIDGLSQRNDPAAAPAVLAVANSPAPAVRLAAINALANLGGAAAIPVLAEAAASATDSETALRDAARAALTQLRPGVPLKTWLDLLPTANPSVQSELVRALGARGERAAIPRLITLADADNEPVRKASSLALAQLADQQNLPALVRLVREAKTDAARADAADALNSACQRIQSLRGRVDVTPLVQGLKGASIEARAALLPVCAGFNAPQVRAALRAALADGDPKVRAAGIRALCGTLDAELLPDLTTLACTVPEHIFRSLAVSGCVRLAAQEESVELSNARRIETLQTLLTANPSAESKRVILAGLANVPDLEALRLVEPMLPEAAVQNEAAQAVLKLASSLPDKRAADAALRKVFAATPDGPTRQAAEAALKQIEKSSAFIARVHDDTFRKRQLTDQFWAEGADLGDFNHDGQMDVVSGPFWYEGPDFKTRHEIWPATNSFKITKSDGTEATIPGFEGALGEKNAYSECFLTFAYDFNGDGWPDVLVIGFPGKAAYWFENPKGAGGPWPRHLFFDEVSNESPVFADVTGDGRPELVCCAHGTLGYLEADWQNPTAPWTYHPISHKGDYQRFTHGAGCGDINGDGRVDIIEKDGWWEQPASRQGDPVWVKHPFEFATAAAQMLVYDVNGDGLNDVITCLNAHGYGLAWYEQVRTDGAISFRRHLILNPDATPNNYGVNFTQPHSLALADINGDGLMDVVTGKRFWAHGKHGPDPESDGFPAALYWFELKRPAQGQVEFVPHLIDADSGVGTQVTVGRIGGQTRPGVVVGNKKGVFVIDRQPPPPRDP
jgi:HEAT repeat protein